MDKSNMSNGDEKLHAHWDCSKGVSGLAMLAACLGAARDPTQTQEWIDDLQMIISRVFHQATSVSLSLNFERLDDGSLKIEHQGHLDESGEWNWSKILEIHAILELHEDALSPWVFESLRAVILELVDAEWKTQVTVTRTNTQLLDFFVEIVGSLWCLDRLRVRTTSCSPLPLAANLDLDLQTRGGTIPLTQQLVYGMTVSLESHLETPVITDTSVALLRVLTGVETQTAPMLTLRATSWGSNNKIPVPHKVRLFIGETLTKDLPRDTPVAVVESNNLWKVNRMTLLETNIDDMTGEHLAFCVDQLLLQGAADAWVTPIVMKKGRAAHTLHCLCREVQTDALLPVVFRHSTTLGVRTQSIDRVALRREMFTVQTEWIDTSRQGRVDVKVGFLGEKAVSVKAEFDHCKEIALEAGIPIQTVADQAVQKANVV